MNSYLSSTEKAQFIRIMHMTDVIAEAIDIYAGLESTDKTFLAELRHGRTRINKAVNLRRSALNKDSDEKLTASVARIHPIFVPTPEAKKAYKEISELQSTLPMNIEDLQDWYGFVIDSTCATCFRADYEECPARRVLSKYEICPMDPGAKGKCQYSYATSESVAPEQEVSGIAEKFESLDLGEELVPPTEIVSQQVQELQAKLELAERRFDFQTEECLELFNANILLVQQLEEIQAKWDNLFDKNKKLADEVEVLTIEQIKENIYGDGDDDSNYENYNVPIILGLNNGNKIVVHLPEYMTSKLIEEIQRPQRLSRGTIAKFIDNELIAVDMQEVVTMQIADFPDGSWVRPQLIEPAYEFTNERELYRIECKCGSEYLATMNAGRGKANCRDCKYTVFADRQADKFVDPVGGSEATLLTNRYFVTNEPRNPQPVQERDSIDNNYIKMNSRVFEVVSELKDIKITNHGRGYKDPCQLFG